MGYPIARPQRPFRKNSKKYYVSVHRNMYPFTYLARLNKPKVAMRANSSLDYGSNGLFPRLSKTSPMVLFTPKLTLGWWLRGENYLNRLAIAVDRHPQVNKLIGP
jgi:hypothetical protein